VWAEQQRRARVRTRELACIAPQACMCERVVTTHAHTHAQVVAALQELYDRHKAAYGWADRPLSIE
jgi:hypothetical protein